jgi:hypothetical protein
MTAEAPSPGWIVEIMGDGTGPRHRRYIVGIPDREAAIRAITIMHGLETVVTATTRLTAEAAGLAKIMPGEILPL